ncbi:MAG TPA: D-hexose-6-phosphate mutarotase [Ramlibacter sp.]|uniref:D-hexose-6-phosphate mutarotase n=1 Tax=Ramlibacter sp. TaxID=1917967 RepID=UPI002ED3CF31
MTAADDARVLLRNRAGDSARVSLHGGQLLSWQPAGDREQIYRSPLSAPAAGKALRGGAPICFPQFSDRGPLPKHGFARTSRWELLSPSASDAEVAQASLQLDSTAASMRWEHAFTLVLVVRMGPGWIELQLEAANTGRAAFAFTAAIHTYLAMQDVRTANVRGLQGQAYEDALDGLALKQEGAATLGFPGEIDRVYRDVPEALALEGGGMPPRRILQRGFPDTVVWNPGPDKAVRLGDMPAQDWLRMLCIEAAAAHPVELAPGKTWRGLQRLELASREPGS